MTGWRALLRPYRVELVASGVLAAVMVVIAGGAMLRMRAFGIPGACFSPARAQVAGCEQFGPGEFNAYYAALGEMLPPAVGATTVVPMLVAIVLGIALVAREIEQQTTVFAWSMSASRISWHLRRVLPIGAIVLGIGIVAGMLGDQVAVARQPFLDPWRNFEGLGGRGPVLAGAALLAFGVSLHTGAILGRQLPSLVLGGLIFVPALLGVSIATDAWLRTDATIEVIDFSVGVEAGARELDSLIATPEGEFIGWDEAYARFGSEVEQIGTGASDLQIAVRFVPAERYPLAVARLTLVLGGLGLTAILLTALIVDRRRPYQ
jgi:hypothetical protein